MLIQTAMLSLVNAFRPAQRSDFADKKDTFGPTNPPGRAPEHDKVRACKRWVEAFFPF